MHAQSVWKRALFSVTSKEDWFNAILISRFLISAKAIPQLLPQRLDFVSTVGCISEGHVGAFVKVPWEPLSRSPGGLCQGHVGACCSGIHPDRKLPGPVLRWQLWLNWLETAFLWDTPKDHRGSFKGFDKVLTWRHFFKFLSGGMFSFQNHSRRMDFRMNVSFRITTCFTLYTLWKPRILSKHAILAEAPQKRTDKVMIFMEFWHFPISQKHPFSNSSISLPKVPWIFCFFSWFWIGWFQEEFRFAMLKVTVQLVRTFEEDFQGNRAPVLVKVTWAPCWRSLRSDPNPFRGALLGCPWYLVN